MGSRFERSADKKLLEKHQQILKELLGRNENKICADCKRRGMSSWARLTLLTLYRSSMGVCESGHFCVSALLGSSSLARRTHFEGTIGGSGHMDARVH